MLVYVSAAYFAELQHTVTRLRNYARFIKIVPFYFSSSHTASLKNIVRDILTHSRGSTRKTNLSLNMRTRCHLVPLLLAATVTASSAAPVSLNASTASSSSSTGPAVLTEHALAAHDKQTQAAGIAPPSVEQEYYTDAVASQARAGFLGRRPQCHRWTKSAACRVGGGFALLAAAAAGAGAAFSHIGTGHHNGHGNSKSTTSAINNLDSVYPGPYPGDPIPQAHGLHSSMYDSYRNIAEQQGGKTWKSYLEMIDGAAVEPGVPGALGGPGFLAPADRSTTEQAADFFSPTGGRTRNTPHSQKEERQRGSLPSVVLVEDQYEPPIINTSKSLAEVENLAALKAPAREHVKGNDLSTGKATDLDLESTAIESTTSQRTQQESTTGASAFVVPPLLSPHQEVPDNAASSAALLKNASLRTSTSASSPSAPLGTALDELANESVTEAETFAEVAHLLVELGDAMMKGNQLKVFEIFKKLQPELAKTTDDYYSILKTINKIQEVAIQFANDKLQTDFKTLTFALVLLYGDVTKLIVSDLRNVETHWRAPNHTARDAALLNLETHILQSIGDTSALWNAIAGVITDVAHEFGEGAFSHRVKHAKKGAARLAMVALRKRNAWLLPTPEGLEMRKPYLKFFHSMLQFVKDLADMSELLKELMLTYGTELNTLWDAMPESDKNLANLEKDPAKFIDQMIVDREMLPKAQKTRRMREMLDVLGKVADRLEKEGKDLLAMEASFPEIESLFSQYLSPVGEHVREEGTQFISNAIQTALKVGLFSADAGTYAGAMTEQTATAARAELERDAEGLREGAKQLVQNFASFLKQEAAYVKQLERLLNWNSPTSGGAQREWVAQLL
ncbi:unnamed protein product [Amoebophrya sp. A120]|nr:unnamed protein product [Amoebophrya sp. A120]|eukprot:GSA120T00005626001.1